MERAEEDRFISGMFRSVFNSRNVSLVFSCFLVLLAQGKGTITRGQIEEYVSEYLIRGREDYAHTGQEAVSKNGLFAQFIYKMQHFTRTGSGQT